MHVETNCPGCGRKLRVGAEYAGQAARCPLCGQIYTVPSVDSAPPISPADSWRLRTPEGKEYGPVAKDVLEQWIEEGRVTDDCQLRCEADSAWQAAGQLYPVLQPEPIVAWAEGFSNAGSLESSGDVTSRSRERIVNAHRGGIILTLGILSWAIGCPVFGLMAWVMGSHDLLEMEGGTMDPAGQAFTSAGRLIGMLHTFVAMAVILVGIFAVLWLRML